MKKAFLAFSAIIILLSSVSCVSLEQSPDEITAAPPIADDTPLDEVASNAVVTDTPGDDELLPESSAPDVENIVEDPAPDWTAPPEVTSEVLSSQTDIPVETTIPEQPAETEATTEPLDTRVITAPSVPPQGDITEIPTDHVIYLTFDDGPGRYTEQLLDVLDKYNIKATFFVVNTSYSKLIAEEYKRGHSVGIHSNTHDYQKIYESDEAFFDDFNAMYDEIVYRTGEGTCLMRFPGGSSNTVSCINPGIMTRLTEEVENRGFTYFDWNVSSGDAGQTVETQQVYENVINGVQNHKISIVLQHDKKGFSVDAVEQIIIWGLENGYTFLPLTKDSPTCHHRIAN